MFDRTPNAPLLPSSSVAAYNIYCKMTEKSSKAITVTTITVSS
jgi:hypothetical protein